MVDADNDGIDDTLERLMLLAVQAGQRAARAIAARLDEAQRERERGNVRQARDLENQVVRERKEALSQLAALRDDKWWQGASPEELAASRGITTQWRDVDSQMREWDDRLADMAANPEAESERRANVQRAAALERAARSVEREDRATMIANWDSPERRQKWAQEMRDNGIDEELIAARLRSDIGFAKHASLATHRNPNRHEPAKRTEPFRGRDHGLER